MPSGSITTAAINASALSTIAGTANRVDYVPFIPARSFNCDQLAIEVTTLLAGSSCYVGIYSDANGSLGSLLAGGQSPLSAAAAGSVPLALSPVFAFVAGTVYWIAVSYSATQTLRGIPLAALIALSVSATGTTPNTVRRATLGGMGALAATAPVSALASAIAPCVRMRVAA